MLELEEPLLQRRADLGFARQGHRVPRLNVGEPVFHLPARLFGPSKLLPGLFALGLELGQLLGKELPAGALAFDRPDDSPGQFGLEPLTGHHVPVGARVECGERRFQSRGSSHDHDRRRQAECANLLDKRGAALRVHLDDDRRGVTVDSQPSEGGGWRLGPVQRDMPCNSVNNTRSHESGAAILCDVENLHRGRYPAFAIYRPMVGKSALTGQAGAIASAGRPRPYVMMPRKNSASSKRRMTTTTNSRKWPREMASCSTAKR